MLCSFAWSILILTPDYVLALCSTIWDVLAQMVNICLQCRRCGFDPRLGRSPGEENGYPLQYPCLENSMDRGAWQTTVHGVAKGQIRLSDFHFQWEINIYLKHFKQNKTKISLNDHNASLCSWLFKDLLWLVGKWVRNFPHQFSASWAEKLLLLLSWLSIIKVTFFSLLHCQGYTYFCPKDWR